MRHARVCFCWNASKCSMKRHTHTERTHAVDRRRLLLFVQKKFLRRAFCVVQKKNVLHSCRCARQSNLSRSLLLFLRGRRASVCALCSAALSLFASRRRRREAFVVSEEERERERLARAFCVKSLFRVVCSAR